MAEFKITRFRYTWKGNWAALDDSTLYYKDDVVYYRGSAWVCIRQHVPTVFDNDQTYQDPGDTLPSPAWTKMSDGREWLGDWTTGRRYDPGVLVLSGGNVYLCVSSHVSSANFSTDLLNWEIFAVGSNFRNTWQAGQRYRVGDVIRYNGYTYQCTVEHTSSSTIEESNWETSVENYHHVGDWQTGQVYRKNDLVQFGGSILKCLEDHTSTVVDSSKFEVYLPGYNFRNEWNNTQQYTIGDIVIKGGTLYISLTNNLNSEPGISVSNPFENASNWSLLDTAVSYKGEFDPQSRRRYARGDLVRRGGALWISTTDQVDDESSLTPFDDSNWNLVISAYNFKGSWRVDEYYNYYDVVYYRGVAYYCNRPHYSSFSTFPGDNGEGFEYWTVVIVGNETSALSTLGDLVTYNLYREVIQDGSTTYTLGDGSTFGPTRIPVGQEDQLLVVENNQGDVGYKVWGNLQRTFFVRTNGVDDNTDPNRGRNYFKPFRTIRFALEQADDGFQGQTTVFVSTGEYEEVLPLIVPVRTAVVGEELRGVFVRANEPIEALASDAQYTLETLLRIGLIWHDIINGDDVDVTVGNTAIQDKTVIGTPADFLIIDNIWGAIISTIDAKVNSNGSVPTVTGSNTASTDPAIIALTQIIENNREFVKAEALAYMQFENPTYTFNSEKCLRDIDRFLDAIKYDILYSGNYKSVLAGRYYANAVTGSALEDMWYVRDSTGLRNMTFNGLNGSLPPLAAGEVYRIPTGGAYVSLDPGWGPNDERVWITNRSCYIQNCTTFGSGAVGQKIDGLLHNGGYKSIVSNDYTQLISDGIGAWVQNGGRAELVSVFTYYAHIGMFAKDGGIIRATNGNNSYGDFGSVADGIDPDEVVRYGYLNTKTEQADIASAFAGEILDYILGLEFRNMGQDYTTASYSISSSGAGASAAQEEFRDDAMFECQILTAGSGFEQYGNQAQFGNETSITLATAENVSESHILGMRIIIISGEGTGQYGYVHSYNSITKLVQVRKESTGEPGWDHILPGTPSKSLLTTGTRYRIEPRPIFNAPPYRAEEILLPNSREFINGVYGETSDTFTNVSGSVGTGSVDETVVRSGAQFTVVKTRRSYTVTITNGGAGYEVNDVIVIDGADLDGISGEHDIRIKVLTTTEDSTNSVLTFEYVGTPIADSGKFILTPAASDTGFYSYDGEIWDEYTLPSSGNWLSIAAGNNRFVAIRNQSNAAAYSTNGVDWTAASMPASRDWRAVTYGKPLNVSTGIFVAVAGNLNAGAYSTNGVTWTSTTLPTAGDSTLCEWTDIAFGAGKFVALANEQNIVAVGTWNGTTLTWAPSTMDVVADSTRKQWVSITYGNRRFVAISDTGDVAYSFDGLTWYPATMPKQDGSTIHNWKKIRYGQGVFFAVGDTGGRTVANDPTTGPTTFAATSYDGIAWTGRELASEESWAIPVFGNPDVTLGDSTVSNSKPMWIIASGTNSQVINKVHTGARALGRAVVSGQGISYMKLWEPGSGYESLPTLELISPAKIDDPVYRTRIADGVLAQPTFLTKGSAYKTSTTYVTVNGDGYADKTPNGKFITLDGLTKMPGPGAQFYISGREDYFVAVDVDIDPQDLPDGTVRATFQISPEPDLNDFLEHGMEVLIRERYSQVRITGHDFLDIGSGNFENTNYPLMYNNYDYNTAPFQEVYNLNGGRVFYTSTDQNGNFRAGDLFAVEQATGIITISADFFDLGGLTELRLAGVTVGSTAVVREFSKDPLFLQNSNNVIPTQRAIRAYLQSRLNIGGEDLLTPSIIAGVVKVGPNLIDNTAGLTVDVPVVADFSGDGAGVSGSYLGQTMFFRSFNLK